MVRLLKALSLALALVTLATMTIVIGSCNSNGVAQIRVINAIPDAASSLDIEFNGSKAVSGVAFDSVYPAPTTPPTYFGETAGIGTIEAFCHGQTANPILDSTNTTLTGGDQYTLLLSGFVACQNSPPTITSPIAAYLISDNNATPSANTVKFRVINGSLSSSTSPATAEGFDIYILPPGQPISGIPTITGLTLGQSGQGYVTFNYLSSYTVWVTAHKSTLPLFDTTYPQNNPQITTLVIVDQPNGTSPPTTVSQTMLELIDVQ
jgi:Domain of unknown function (DUF4397)